MTNKSFDYDKAFEMVQEEIDRILLSAPVIIRRYTSYLTQMHGKFVRAKAVLACALDNDELVGNDAIIFAAAIEVLHLATLVHDDVMDDAGLRRGHETLQKKYGKRTAVICGDYLLSAAIQELRKVEDQDKYQKLNVPDYVSQICLGELRQEINNHNYGLSMYRYLSIINGKTAALFEASYFAGAIVHETDEEKLRKYRQLGRYTGVIFQLTDDCIDYENDEDTALKSVHSDFEQGVITLPVIHTFAQKPELKKKAEEGILSKEELIDAVAKCNGVSFTHHTAKRYYDKAKAALDALELSGKKGEILSQLLDKSYYGLKK